MPYTKQDCFDKVKGIIYDMFTYISSDKITPDAKMNKVLGFDIIDRINIITEFEYKYNVSIKNDAPLMIAMTLDEFCDALCKDLNTKEEDLFIAKQKPNLFNRLRTSFIRQKQ